MAEMLSHLEPPSKPIAAPGRTEFEFTAGFVKLF
jgi:hypothetical protein